MDDHRSTRRLAALILCLLAGCGSGGSNSVRTRKLDDLPTPGSGTSPLALTELAQVLATNGLVATSLKTQWKTGTKEILSLELTGAEAVDVWFKLRRLLPQTGRWPVIVGDGDAVQRHAESLEMNPKPEEALAAAEKLDIRSWLDEVEKESRKTYEGIEGLYDGSMAGAESDDERFTIPTDILNNRWLPKVYILLMPSPVPWEAPAYLGFGGWNECPGPERQVALMKHWHQKFGAEVVGISGDVVEMLVLRPPTTREEALALAKDQFHYCSDIVSQGVGSVPQLAGTLLNAKVWFFWWD